MFGWFRKYVRKIGIFGVEVEFHPPTEPVAPSAAPAPATGGNPEPVAASGTRAEASKGRDESSSEGGAGLTFDAVIRAIRERYPDAPLGRTAEQGPYYERAKGLTNYRMHTSDPPCYAAAQPNGKTMWLYLGKGGKICCGDKE